MATMRPPSPRRDRRSSARLVDDLMREIFLRLPPHDPEGLVRAAAGCRSWRGILSDAAFALDYRARRRVPPMLGFLYEEVDAPVSRFSERYWVSHFVPTPTFRPPACRDRPYWHVLDSRHGLVLFYTPLLDADFVVCDLVTGDQWEIHANPRFARIMRWEWDREDLMLQRIRCNAAVLCAKDRCDHFDCHGGPFRVALVGSVRHGSIAGATVYSSETREWSDKIVVQSPDYIQGAGMGHNAVVGNKVYVPFVEGDSVIEYNMDEQKLSVIDAPDTNHSNFLLGVEDSMLLFASVKQTRLCLWSMGVGPDGAVEWAQHRIIDIGTSLPPDVISDLWYTSLVGFAEGVSVIFLSTRNGLYTIDLNSGEGKKVHERQIGKVMPYMSFYTGAWGRLPTSNQASHAVVGATTI